ncbi:CBASS oligonucleotide cyclase [Phenylobacterium soli]|uniref:Nucleotidyltransferase n=1 Tax=Phenylobacterium soli TaxID=2170551 RepID=A0A328AIY5_9CAUL|nr:CBASS oligonucleotide cyclase [Phenylobacterium soli]RAK54903.1 nucleotidyltransferase [Phenylobacterium soli]
MSKVSDAFQTFKTRLEITQTEQDDASRRQKDVRATVQANFDVERDFLTGSYGRRTKTKPLKDIDIFVVLGKDEKWRRDKHPKGVLDDLEKCLVDAYGEDQVERDRRCVTVYFQKKNQTQHEDGKVLSLDVVPAFGMKDGYDIPDDTLGTWIKTDPEIHAEEATAKNKALAGGWVPLVKMLKSWNRSNGKSITPSYLIEVMALELVDGPFSNFPDEARRFFAAAQATVGDDWPDPAGLGPLVSDEMTAARCATARQKLREAEVAATRAFRAEQQGYEGEAVRIWKEIFGDFFPAS